MYSKSDVNLYLISQIFGWTYFVAWTVSFYPQLYTNFRRKSVIGLNLDFLTLNITGFLCYSLFNLGLYFNPKVVSNEDIHNNLNPVQINDVVFSLHALVISMIIGLQAFIYERGDQRVSKVGKSLIGFIYLSILICSGLAIGHVISWITFLYIISYVKVFITAIKYIPQAYLNYRRKSTVGWNVWGVLLDAIGGSFSLTQMFLISCAITPPTTHTIAAVRSDCVRDSFFGNPTKMLLGMTSLVYDAIMVYQHYVLYPDLSADTYQEIPGNTLIPEEHGPDDVRRLEDG